MKKKTEPPKLRCCLSLTSHTKGTITGVGGGGGGGGKMQLDLKHAQMCVSKRVGNVSFFSIKRIK